MAAAEPTMESFFGTVWTEFAAQYRDDVIKTDMARWAFRGVFDNSHIGDDFRSVIDARIAKFESTDFEALARAKLTAEAEVEWANLPDQVSAEARVIPKGNGDGDRRFQAKQHAFLSFTKEGYVAARLTANVVGSCTACRDHYHKLETEQLKGQSVADVVFVERGDVAAAPAPREVTAVVDGGTDVDSYASGFAMGDCENGAFRSNLFSRLEACAVRVYVARSHYRITTLDDADESHRVMALTFVDLVGYVLDHMVDMAFDLHGRDEEAKFRADWKSEMAGGFYDDVLF